MIVWPGGVCVLLAKFVIFSNSEIARKKKNGARDPKQRKNV